MPWTVRHEGSPRSVEGLELSQVLQGLADGLWEPTDEVKGPDDTDWTTLENHPATAEAAAEIEPPPPRTYDDETHLDMNALIDVCLVLLIFFILIASYAALQKRLEAPNPSTEGAGPVEVTEKEVSESMIRVSLSQDGNTTAVMVEGVRWYPDSGKTLEATLQRYVTPGKTRLLLEHDPKVPHGEVVRVQDAAKGAGITKVFVLVPEDETKKP
jgi:biopolymer transport protein ExbD